jgi:hypothetical protein
MTTKVHPVPEAKMNAAVLEDVRAGQVEIAKSNAKLEGQMEGFGKALDTINASLAGVIKMQTDIAEIKERDRHPDPELALMTARIVLLETFRDDTKEEERWERVHGIVRTVLASIGGGSVVSLVHWLRG